MRLLIHIVFASTALAAVVRRDDHKWENHECEGKIKRVAIFSFDGMHASDLDKYLARGPSNFTQLLNTGYKYTNAYSTDPSDSFPGTLAQFTGATPKTTGVWYDDTFDRTYFAPNSSCKGSPGAEVVYDESIDVDDNKLFSGGIDPAKLPQAIINGKCTSVYPHMRTRVNTVFEVVSASGKATAYADKHPAYDLVRGPSGKGLTTGYFPEINNADNPTANVSLCIPYDTLHVNAFLGWLDGKDPANAEGSLKGEIPTLFGGNFQSISVGQKTKGYVEKTLDFSPDLLKAMQFADASLGLIINKLKAKGLYDETLIVVASKHGQAPIDPTLYKKVDPKNFTTGIGVNTSFITFDDTALVFLKNHSDLDLAVKNLNAQKSALRISDMIYGQALIDQGYGDPTKDPAVPDIIVHPVLGTIYTTSTAKIAEHGGGSDDDRHVACFVSNPHLSKKVFDQRVDTKSVAPVVLGALGLDAGALAGVKAERTRALPGFEAHGGH